MYTYANLKKQEKELLEQLENINKDNINLLSQLTEYRLKYPKEFSVISVDLSKIDLERILYRLIILQDDVNISNNINEDEKKRIINLINVIGQKSKEKFEECSEVKEQLEKNKTEIENRKNYVLEKVNLIKENKNKQQVLEDKKNFYEKLILHKYCEPSIKEESQRIVDSINLEQNIIQNEINTLAEEPNLKEDYNLINNGMPIEELRQEEKIEEEQEKEMLIQENKSSILLPENDKYTTETSNVPDLDAVKPEEPLKVILKKKASPELINKIKSGGKTALGILIIGAAVAAVIANPMALLAIPAGGLLYDQAKEHILKK